MICFLSMRLFILRIHQVISENVQMQRSNYRISRVILKVKIGLHWELFGLKLKKRNIHIARKHYQRTLPANMIKKEEKMFTLPGIIIEEHYQKNIAKEHCQETLPKNTARDHHRRTLPANIICEHCCGDGKWIHYLVWSHSAKRCFRPPPLPHRGQNLTGPFLCQEIVGS